MIGDRLCIPIGWRFWIPWTWRFGFVCTCADLEVLDLSVRVLTWRVWICQHTYRFRGFGFVCICTDSVQIKFTVYVQKPESLNLSIRVLTQINKNPATPAPSIQSPMKYKYGRSSIGDQNQLNPKIQICSNLNRS